MPNKILFKISENKTFLDYLLIRLKKICRNNLVVATTENENDNEIVKIAMKNNVKYYRGDENNVYMRFYKTSKYFKCNNICRLCSDNPLIDLNLIIKMSEFYSSNNLDCVSSFGILGIDKYISIFNIEKLHKFYHNFTDKNKEHVTSYMYENMSKFKVKFIKYKNINYEIYNNVKLSLDTYDDYKFIKKIIFLLSDDNRDSIIKILLNHKKLWIINDNIYKKNDIISCNNLFKKIKDKDTINII